MASAILGLQRISIISNIADKNAKAHEIIQRYAARHALMDIGIGVISLIPGAALPAIFGAIALQNKEIYRPMASELADVYLRQTDGYTDELGNIAAVSTVALEFAQEFAIEFLVECAQELILETSLAAAATFIPLAGAIVAAGLDYCIAQMLTWRVGTMCSIYFQNGEEWIGNRKTTLGIAKELTGGVVVGASEIWKVGKMRLEQLKTPPEKRRVPEPQIRVNLDSIPKKVELVKQAGVNVILAYIADLAEDLSKERIRQRLTERRIASILIDAAMEEFYA